MPTLPVDHDVALTSSVPSIVVNPFARPFSQSITAFGANSSGVPPTVTHPCDSPVPGASEWTTANPRGTQVLTSDVETFARSALNAGSAAGTCAAAAAAPSFLLHIPQELARPRRAGEVRRRLVDHRHLQAFGVGLLRPRDVHEHAIVLAVACPSRIRSRPRASAESTATDPRTPARSAPGRQRRRARLSVMSAPR